MTNHSSMAKPIIHLIRHRLENHKLRVCRRCGLELKVGDEIYSLPRGSGMVRYHKKCFELTQYDC